jgi:two-component system, NtrC family, response regulator HydG
MPSDRGRILVVDDHAEMARLLADQLADAGYVAETAASVEAALVCVKKRLFDVVVTDLRMEKLDGFDLLDAVRRLDPSLPILIMTAFGAIDSAIEAIKRGAFHYLTKPFRLEEVLLYVERAIADRRLRVENVALRRMASERAGLGGMIGRSEPMRAMYDLVERVAQSAAPVLIRGESGTGKELVARALHFLGPRRERPFVAVNCTTLPEALLESEVFGHVRGAYTGATAARRGLFVEADGGTLLLDEIGDMAPALQAKLLRALEDGEVRAVGSDVSRKVDVRVLCATHQDLEKKVKEGGFRADLFYRLNVVPVTIPPLRARADDVPPLAEHFLARARARNPRSPVERFSPDALAALARRPWPGNVRELEHVVERLVIVGTQPVLTGAALAELSPSPADDPPPVAEAKTQLPTLRRLEGDYIAWVIERCDGNKTRAAEILGIDVSTIHRRERGGS